MGQCVSSNGPPKDVAKPSERVADLQKAKSSKLQERPSAPLRSLSGAKDSGPIREAPTAEQPSPGDVKLPVRVYKGDKARL